MTLETESKYDFDILYYWTLGFEITFFGANTNSDIIALTTFPLKF